MSDHNSKQRLYGDIVRRITKIVWPIVSVPLILSASGILSDQETEFKLADATPLTWNLNNLMLVGYQNSIYLYDPVDNTIKRMVSTYNPANVTKHNCFTPDGGTFELPSRAENSDKMQTSASSSTKVLRSITDWENPSQYADNQYQPYLEPNQLDCGPVDLNKRHDFTKRVSGTANTQGAIVIGYQTSPLLKSAHGESYLLTRRESNGSFSRYLEVFSSKDDSSTPDDSTHIAIKLNNDKSDIADNLKMISSYFDEQQGNYVFYEISTDFEQRRKEWPLAAWRVSSDLKILNQFDLPPGPWVIRYSLNKLKSCPPCGCSCESNFYLKGGGGKIYAHISGQGVEDKYAGIYELIDVETAPKWKVRYSGNFSQQIHVSPDGCHIMFTGPDNTLNSMNSCNLAE